MEDGSNDGEVVGSVGGSQFAEEEVLAMRSFGAISPERRKALDGICEVNPAAVQVQESAELWEEYFEQQAAGLSAAEANILWHQMMTDAFEAPRSAEAMDARSFFGTPVRPATELEERYVAWRRDFNQRRKIESLAEEAVAARRENRALKGDLQGKVAAIDEMVGGPIDFFAKMRSAMDGDAFSLFCALMAPDDVNAGKTLSLEKIGARFGGITKQAVSVRVVRFRAAHPKAWAFVEGVRRRRKSIAFSAQSPRDRRKEGVEENYGTRAGS
jgi:hypothetical protein